MTPRYIKIGWANIKIQMRILHSNNEKWSQKLGCRTVPQEESKLHISKYQYVLTNNDNNISTVLTK